MSDAYKIHVDEKNIKTKSALLWVSVGGGRDFDGERFMAIARWAKNTFDKVYIDLADTDKAINYEAFEGLSKDLAYHTAKAAGDLWLVRNSEAVDLIGKENLIRFDHWTRDERHLPHRQKLEELYEKNDIFRSAVNKDAAGYVAKKSPIFKPELQDGCVRYILNEMAACIVRASELGATCVYPAKQKEAFRLVRDEIVQNPSQLHNEPYLPINVEHKKSHREKAYL